MFKFIQSARRSGKSQSLVDYAAITNHTLMLGSSQPRVWADYLKSNFPQCKFKLVEGGILINPKDK